MDQPSNSNRGFFLSGNHSVSSVTDKNHQEEDLFAVEKPNSTAADGVSNGKATLCCCHPLNGCTNMVVLNPLAPAVLPLPAGTLPYLSTLNQRKLSIARFLLYTTCWFIPADYRLLTRIEPIPISNHYPSQPICTICVRRQALAQSVKRYYEYIGEFAGSFCMVPLSLNEAGIGVLDCRYQHHGIYRGIDCRRFSYYEVRLFHPAVQENGVPELFHITSMQEFHSGHNSFHTPINIIPTNNLCATRVKGAEEVRRARAQHPNSVSWERELGIID